MYTFVYITVQLAESTESNIGFIFLYLRHCVFDKFGLGVLFTIIWPQWIKKVCV